MKALGIDRAQSLADGGINLLEQRAAIKGIKSKALSESPEQTAQGLNHLNRKWRKEFLSLDSFSALPPGKSSGPFRTGSLAGFSDKVVFKGVGSYLGGVFKAGFYGYAAAVGADGFYGDTKVFSNLG